MGLIFYNPYIKNASQQRKNIYISSIYRENCNYYKSFIRVEDRKYRNPSFIPREFLLRKCITKRSDSKGSTRRGGGPRKSISCSNYYRCRRRQMFAGLKRSPPKALNSLILFLSGRWKTHEESTPFQNAPCTNITNAIQTKNECILSWIRKCRTSGIPHCITTFFLNYIKNLNVNFHFCILSIKYIKQ